MGPACTDFLRGSTVHHVKKTAICALNCVYYKCLLFLRLSVIISQLIIMIRETKGPILRTG